MSLICKIIAFRKEILENKNQSTGQQTGTMAVIEILSNLGDNKRIVISRSQELNLELGDKIRCVSGQVVVLINHGIEAGSQILSETSPILHLSKFPSLLEITAELTKNQPLGKTPKQALNDIGQIIRSAATTTKKFTENVNR